MNDQSSSKAYNALQHTLSALNCAGNPVHPNNTVMYSKVRIALERVAIRLQRLCIRETTERLKDQALALRKNAK
jgi:hypothetical protein